MVCLDTDIIIDYLRNEEYAIKIIKQLEKQEIISSTSINSLELFNGVYKSSKKNDFQIINKFLININILNFDYAASLKAAEILNYLKLKGEQIELPDIMIASIAITNNQTLLTNNKNHFQRIPELILKEVC